MRILTLPNKSGSCPKSTVCAGVVGQSHRAAF